MSAPFSGVASKTAVFRNASPLSTRRTGMACRGSSRRAGIIVSYETIRQWCQKFGPDYARKLKRREGRLGDHWHLDEVFIRINGQQQYLWRAVDQDGDVIDILVQPHRDQRAAERFFRRLLRWPGRRTTADHYRQTEKLLRCHTNHLRQRDSQCGAIRQQSSRSLASADPPTGTANAPIQIC